MPSYTPGDSYPVLPVPSFTDPVHTYGSTFGGSDAQFHAPVVLELLASTEGYTQRGVILAAGQGILPTGTVLAQYTGGGNQYQYGVYVNGGSNGLGVPVGFLRNGVDTGGASGTPAQQVAGLLVYRGIVNYAVTSGLDANAMIQANLNGRVDAATNVFIF